MEKPDYNDGTSVECQVGQHPAVEVFMCENPDCDTTYCEKHGSITYPGLCYVCGEKEN